MVSQGKKTKEKVFVGLSGGVDSAVSAALLKKEGYEVSGVFIKAWTPPGYPCTWKEDRRSAMRAAAILDIPFFTLDLEKEYKEGVVDYMIAEYKSGKTPNPDVMCNKEIKFGAFLDWAKNKGADYIATGHYARTSPPSPPLLVKERGLGGEVKLMEGKDKNKDQSYFLWTLTQEQLKHTLFPVGNIKKDKVRELAEQFKLPQAIRKDSQGLCFLGQVDMKEFLGRYIEQKKGDVLNAVGGEVIGYHSGAVFFTIGERHGFTITKKGALDKPLYVVAKDIEKNTITVSVKSLMSKVESKKKEAPPIILENINWINGKIPENKNLSCRLRYRQEKIPCEIVMENNEVKVFLKKDDYISAGQSLVFYDGETCLGGGIMK